MTTRSRSVNSNHQDAAGQTDLTGALSGSFDVTVSVLIPAFRASSVLPRALQSVVSQDFEDWEVYVIDDASDDTTFDVAEDWARQDRRIKVIRSDVSLGAAGARNLGLAQARGRFIAFLDADDMWLPHKLRMQMQLFQSREVGLVYGGFRRIGPWGERTVHVPSSVSYEALLRGNCIGCLTAVYDRQVYGSVRMPDLPMRHDFALWLELLKRRGPALAVEEAVAVYHVSAGSLSSSKLKAIRATWTMYRRHFGFSRIRSAGYVLSHLAGRLRRG